MNTNNEEGIQVGVQRIYIKDISFEVPNPIKTFKEAYKPELKVELRSSNSDIEPHLFETVLEITITAENNGEVAFIAEVEQAGIFSVKGLSGERLSHFLGTYCLSILFPYAREAIDNLAIKGSFPPVSLAPINFEALYASRQGNPQES